MEQQYTYFVYVHHHSNDLNLHLYDWQSEQPGEFIIPHIVQG